MLGKGCSGHRPIPSVCQHASEEGCPKHPMPPHTRKTRKTEPQAPCPEFVNTPQKRVVSALKVIPTYAHDRVDAHSPHASRTPRVRRRHPIVSRSTLQAACCFRSPPASNALECGPTSTCTDSSSLVVSRSSTKAAGNLVDSALGNNVSIASRVHMIRARA